MSLGRRRISILDATEQKASAASASPKGEGHFGFLPRNETQRANHITNKNLMWLVHDNLLKEDISCVVCILSWGANKIGNESDGKVISFKRKDCAGQPDRFSAPNTIERHVC